MNPHNIHWTLSSRHEARQQPTQNSSHSTWQAAMGLVRRQGLRVQRQIWHWHCPLGQPATVRRMVLTQRRPPGVTAEAAGCFHRHNQVGAGHWRLFSRELERSGFQSWQHYCAALWRQTRAEQDPLWLALSERGWRTRTLTQTFINLMFLGEIIARVWDPRKGTVTAQSQRSGLSYCRSCYINSFHKSVNTHLTLVKSWLRFRIGSQNAHIYCGFHLISNIYMLKSMAWQKHKSKTLPAPKVHGHRHRGKFLLHWEPLLVYSVLGKERWQQGDVMQFRCISFWFVIANWILPGQNPKHSNDNKICVESLHSQYLLFIDWIHRYKCPPLLLKHTVLLPVHSDRVLLHCST